MSLSFPYSADRNDDFIEVVDSVQRLAASWSKLALYIHVKSDAIKTIEQNHPRDAQQCLLESIMEWLKKNYNFERFGPPSWRMLVRAVKRLDNALAHDIADAHRGKSVWICEEDTDFIDSNYAGAGMKTSSLLLHN